MKEKGISKKPFIKGITYGFLTLLFSHIPILLVFCFEWAKENQIPEFSFAFDSGGLIAIWIPILAMLLFSFYSVRDYNEFPFWGNLSFIMNLLLLIVTIAMYTCFFQNYLPYGNWVKWVSICIVVILFLLLSFSRFLELKAPKDFTESRANDQDQLNDKLTKLQSK
jgi:magnesium-transporting ATPase (P-type)